MTSFTKGQSVTNRDGADYRYVIETAHRDGSFTVRAMFALDDQGNDRPGYLGYRYRVSADTLAPLPSKQAA